MGMCKEIKHFLWYFCILFIIVMTNSFFLITSSFCEDTPRDTLHEYETVLSRDPHNQEIFFHLNSLYDQLFDRFQNKFFSKKREKTNKTVADVHKIENLYFQCFKKQIYQFYGIVVLCIVLGIVCDSLVIKLFKKIQRKTHDT